MLKRLVSPAATFCVFAATILALLPAAAWARAENVEDAQFALALGLYREGRYDEAIVEFHRLLEEFRPGVHEAAGSFYLASSYFSTGDYNGARSSFQTVTERFGKSAYRAPALYYLARIDFLEERFESSISLFSVYEREYPRLGYADNSLYWKGKAYLGLGEREKAKHAFRDVLKKYPDGDKAETARFELRILDMEDRLSKAAGELAASETSAPPHPEAQADTAELEKLLALREEELGRMAEKERLCAAEVARLNNEVESLKTELDNLKSTEAASEAAQEKIRSLVAWEALLTIKEQALNQKEQELNEAFEKLKKERGERR